MKIYEIYEEDRKDLMDMAEDIQDLATNIVECLKKAEKREDTPDSEMSFRRSPRLRRGRSRYTSSPSMRGSQISSRDVPPHMRGYIVRPEDEDWAYNERYNW